MSKKIDMSDLRPSDTRISTAKDEYKKDPRKFMEDCLGICGPVIPDRRSGHFAMSIEPPFEQFYERKKK